MNLFLDTTTNKFVTSPFDSTPVLSINLTRGDTIPLEVGFVQNGSVLTLSGYNVSIGFKQGGLQNYSGAYLAYANSFTIDTGQLYSPLYSTYLSLANTGIDSLFTGVTPVKLIGQMSYGISGLTEISSYSLTANVFDDINKPSGSYPDNSFVTFPAYITGGSGIQTTVSGNTLVINATGTNGGSGVSNINIGTNASDILTFDSDSDTLDLSNPVNQANGLVELNSSNQYPGLDGSQILNVLQSSNNLSDLSNTSSAVANLGLMIGANVEAWSASLDTLAATTIDGSYLTAFPAAVDSTDGLASFNGLALINLSSNATFSFPLLANLPTTLAGYGVVNGGSIDSLFSVLFSTAVLNLDGTQAIFGSLTLSNGAGTNLLLDNGSATAIDSSYLTAFPTAVDTDGGLASVNGLIFGIVTPQESTNALYALNDFFGSQINTTYAPLNSPSFNGTITIGTDIVDGSYNSFESLFDGSAGNVAYAASCQLATNATNDGNGDLIGGANWTSLGGTIDNANFAQSATNDGNNNNIEATYIQDGGLVNGYPAIGDNILFRNTVTGNLVVAEGGSYPGALTDSGIVASSVAVFVTPPALSTSAGSSNQIASDANYFYVYDSGSSTWLRFIKDPTF